MKIQFTLNACNRMSAEDDAPLVPWFLNEYHTFPTCSNITKSSTKHQRGKRHPAGVLKDEHRRQSPNSVIFIFNT
jgi:hypothetical protein